MFEQDFVMRQIHDMVRMLAKLFLHKDTVTYEFCEEKEKTDTDFLYQKILDRLNDGDINGAENMLYENFLPGNETYMTMCLDFYGRLNELSEEYLSEHDYSREEIEDGLKMFAQKNGISL